MAMGVYRVKLATFISAVISAVFMPIRAVLILRKKKNNNAVIKSE